MAGNLPDPAASLTSARKAAAALTVLAGAMVAAMAGWNAVRGWMQVTEASGPQAATLLNSRELGGIALPNWNGEWLMLVLGGFGLWLGGLTMASAPRQRRLGTWLLLIVGVAGALLAAEMLQVGVTSPEARLRLLGWLSLPKLATTKVAMIAMIILGLGLATHGSGSSASTTSIGPFHTTKFLLVLLQLSGLLLVVQTFSIENEVFHGRLMPLILAGFAIHAVLPPDLRATFFLLLSLGSILGVFGATDGGILVGLGLVLIGVCHLPIAFWYRLIILLGLVGALVALRAGLASVAWSQAIWPVLGSMFMFRLVVYLYDLKHAKVAPTLTSTLSYFFMLPNVAFPLFPVVDYAAFRRTYQDTDQYQVYQTGLNWVFRGVTHLLLYRFVYYYVVIGPADVVTMGDLVQYMVSNFLLILRLSGQFHLIVGILHLFGFNLPAIMHRYWLATGFTDFWRRTNIYWKDFMQKVVFYPLSFRLRSWSLPARLITGTLVVFAVTWFFHAYQWFWLRGSFLLAGTDVAFWVLFGALVAVNTFWEARHGRPRQLGKPAWSLSALAGRSLRVTGTFTVICLLWSIWISTSFDEWLSLWSAVTVPSSDLVYLLPILLCGVVLTGAVSTKAAPTHNAGASVAPSRTFLRSAVTTGALVMLVYLAAQPGAAALLGPRVAAFVSDMQKNRLNRTDTALMHRGYYENLTRVNRFNSQLWEVYNRQPSSWNPARTPRILRSGSSFFDSELAPKASMTIKNVPLTTNRWGMRDQDYEKTPPPGTHRTALIGGSYAMGGGVGDGQCFEALVEERLNARPPGDQQLRHEILNFAVDAAGLLARLWILETRALDFQPHTVLYVGHPTDINRSLTHLAKKTADGFVVPFDFLQQVLDEAGVTNNMSEMEILRRLRPHSEHILRRVYARIAQICLSTQTQLLYLHVPLVEDAAIADGELDLRLAREAGFTVLDLSDVWDSIDNLGDVRLAAYDMHPNVRGHAMIAERLYQEITERQILPASTPSAAATSETNDAI